MSAYNKTSTGLALALMFSIAGAMVFAEPQESVRQPADNQQPSESSSSAQGSMQEQVKVPTQSTQPTRADDTRLYMRAKLASSQKVMEGLVSEKYQLIIDGATQMKEISEAAHWPTSVDEVYQHYSVEFRRQCDKLKKQAERGDLQAAHYTYLHLSTTCIDCHNYVRPRFDVKRSKQGAPVQLIPTYWDSKEPSIRRPQPDEEKQDKTG